VIDCRRTDPATELTHHAESSGFSVIAAGNWVIQEFWRSQDDWLSEQSAAGFASPHFSQTVMGWGEQTVILVGLRSLTLF
jgi:hypothetical protein